MKTITSLLLMASLAAGMSVKAAEPPTHAPVPPTSNAASVTNAAAPVQSAPALATQPAATAITAPATNAAAPGATNAVVADMVSTNPPSMQSTNFPTDGLRLNFRNVPLELVLNYLSDAAGFIIVLDTDVRGKVDVWSNTPLTKDEAVSLLNSVLNKNGYAAIRNGRTLTIVARDAAKTRDLPVKKGSEPNDIPKNDEMVTQIIPVRNINAAQLTKDLQPLMPLSATMTANEGGNALVITDTQANIHRMAEIVQALDTSVSTFSSIRVYPLRFADAKTVATVIKDLFTQQDASRNPNDLRAQFFQRMRGGGGPFGGGGPGGDQNAGSTGNPRTPAPKVVATSDDRSNSLVVSAPDEMIQTIDNLVKEIDINVEDVTEVRVFHLSYADPVEMADLLAGLFPDDTRNDATSTRGGNVQFGGGFFGGRSFGGRGAFGGRTQGNAAQQSDRAKKMSRVLAVPDQRTASVVVSAAKDLMEQISEMVTQLDSNPAKKQKVFVYQVENGDVQEMEQILRDMFDRNGTMNNRNTANQQNNALNSRATSQQNQNLRNTGLGSGGLGNNRSGGGLGR